MFEKLSFSSDRLRRDLPVLFVEVEYAAFAVALNSHADEDLCTGAGLDIETRLLTAAHALQEVA